MLQSLLSQLETLSDRVDAAEGNLSRLDVSLTRSKLTGGFRVFSRRFVIDETVLEISNKWRKERGESELDMKSIVPDME